MQRIFLLGLAFVVTLAAALGIFLFLSLWPYFSLIGKVAAGVVIVGLGCSATLMIAFTYSKVGIWNARRRIITQGEVVVFRNDDGSFVHLSAMHEQAKLPPPQVTVKELPEPQSTDETILELYHKGMSLRDIVKLTGSTYYRVQKVCVERG